MRTIAVLPPELTKLLFDLGPRKLILLEGDTDCEIFREWYAERRSEVEFYPSTGYANVQEYLQALLGQFATMKAYGIIDRDFREEEEVEAPLQDPAALLFILRKYSLENYLLEPGAVFEELRVYHGSTFSVPDVATMGTVLLELCRVLSPVMAANWVFYDVGGIEYFTLGDNRSTEAELLPEVARRLGCDEAEAKKQISEKEALLQPFLSDLERAHTRISGKHLLHRLYMVYVIGVKHGLVKDHFRRLLARSVKERIGMHLDIRTIVEERILRA